MKIRTLLHSKFLAGIALCVVGPVASAAVVDQHNDGLFAGGFTLNAGPIGQSFRPSLNAVDFVDLLINDQNPDTGGGDDIAVRIRQGDITGTVLGTSQNVFFADQVPMPFQEPVEVHFSFTSPVTLVAGNTYVVEVFRNGAINSDLGIFGTGFNNDAYPLGVSYFQGAVFAGNLAPFDLWFREGVSAVPLPAAAFLLAPALGGLGLMRRRAS